MEQKNVNKREKQVHKKQVNKDGNKEQENKLKKKIKNKNKKDLKNSSINSKPDKPKDNKNLNNSSNKINSSINNKVNKDKDKKEDSKNLKSISNKINSSINNKLDKDKKEDSKNLKSISNKINSSINSKLDKDKKEDSKNLKSIGNKINSSINNKLDKDKKEDSKDLKNSSNKKNSSINNKVSKDKDRKEDSKNLNKDKKLSSKTNKSNKGSFVKQAAILAIASLLVRLLGFLYRLPLTDMLGDEGNGIYSAGYYLYNFFLVMSSAGLPVAISKLVAEKVSIGEYKNVQRIFVVALAFSSVTGCICSVMMFLFAEEFCYIIGSPDSYYAIITLAPTVFIVSIMSVFRGYFQGLGTTAPTAYSQVIEQIFNAGFSIYLAYMLVQSSIALGAAGGTAGTGIGALAGLIYIVIYFAINKKNITRGMSKSSNRAKNYKVDSDAKIIKNIVFTATPIIAGTAIFSMTNLIDMQMVNTRLADTGVFTDTEINVLYGQLTGKYVTITTLPVSISTALAMATMPSIATSITKKDYQTVKEKIDTSLRLTMIISIPAAVGIGVLADPILKFLFPNVPDGGVLLKYGSVSILFLALCQILTGILQGIGKLSVPAMSAFIGSIIKIPINYYLIAIPQVNVLGAVVSTTACYIVASGLNFIALKRAIKIKPDYSGIFIKPMMSSIIMGLSCSFSYNLINNITKNNNLAVVSTIFIGIIVYGVVLAVIGGLRKEDIELLPMGGKIAKVLERLRVI